MQRNPRYYSLDRRVVTTLESKRDALNPFIQHDENRCDTYILSQSSSHLLALNSISIDFNSYEQAVLFLKTNLTSKLAKENLEKDVAVIELYLQEIIHYMDIIGRDVYIIMIIDTF